MLGSEFEPVMKMAENASKLQEIADKRLANDGYIEDAEGNEIMTYAESLINANKEWERVAPYVAAKLKAVEIDLKGEVDVKEYRGVQEVSERIEGLLSSGAAGDSETRTTH